MSNNNESTIEQSGEESLNERVEAERISRDLSYKQLVTALKLEDEVSLPALRRWLKGENIQAQHLVAPAAQRWLGELEEPRHERTVTPFVETRLANQVMSALTWAKAHNEMVAVIGEPGLGKTRSIRQVQATYEDVWVATMDPTVSALVPCLQRVAEAVSSNTLHGGASHIAHGIRERVDGRRGLLIIDESQHLGLPALDTLRSIHDDTDVALALVGNPYSYARFTGHARAAQYGQIKSRIGLLVDLGQPVRADVRAMASKFGLDDPKILGKLERAAQHHGTMRNVAKALLQASSDGRKCTPQRVEAALRNLKVHFGAAVTEEEVEA